jgi:Xaa-Pro aminopeptidase
VEGGSDIVPPADALKADLDRRVRAAQQLLKDLDLHALVAVCGGSSQHNGWVRYFTNAELWGGRVFLLIQPAAPTTRIVLRSTYDEQWVREQVRQQTCMGEVESTLIQQIPPVRRVAEILAGLTGRKVRIGMLRMAALTVGEHATLRHTLPDSELVDVTDEMNARRQIKSPFEVEAVRETAQALTRGMQMFAERARPGRRVLEVVGEVDGYLRGQGCFWGRITCAVDQRLRPLPAPRERRLAPDDVLLVRCVHSGPLGYWCEMTRVFAFSDPPPTALRRLGASVLALQEAARYAAPGQTYGGLLNAVERVFSAEGLRVTRGRRLACEPMGTDENEAESMMGENWQFKEHMVLALHPAAVLDDERGFLLGDTYVVRSGGAVPVSPETTPHYWRLQ